MKVKVQIVIESSEYGTYVKDILNCEREKLSAETLGLTLKETKEITSNAQKIMAEYQIKEFVKSEQICSECNKVRKIKGYSDITYRTLFGKLKLNSPRLHQCECSSASTKTFSPLVHLLSERISPELSYLQSKWASLMSYGMTVNLLEEVLPLNVSVSSVMNDIQKVSDRMDKELGDEKVFFVDGCPRDWDNLPKPGLPLTVGIDGGYIHGREGRNRKAGWFEVIVGKGIQQGTETKRFGFITKFDNKPKRRLYEMLKKQGLQMNQRVTFLSDGGENVRELQLYLSPQAEHILDWFHIAMKLTVMNQIVKGLPCTARERIEKQLESIKWYLWHGNVFKGLQNLERLCLETENLEKDNREANLCKLVNEFYGYIDSNKNFIVNYGERYNHGERIATGFVESTVNELISKRMAKKQQMRWTKNGAHCLLQLRIKTLNKELRESFCKWYPEMNGINQQKEQENDEILLKRAA